MKNSESIKTLWVNPVERISLQGRHKQVYTINTGSGIMPTVSMHKSKELNTTAEYAFPVNYQTNKLQTGLNVMIDNPLYGMSPEEVFDQYEIGPKWQNLIPDIVKTSNIKKQTWLEIKHSVDPDYYTDRIGYTMSNMPSDMKEWGKDKTYLQSLKLILYPRPNSFSSETPRQELLMHMIEVLPYIAKTKNEANSAFHDWYISEENEAEIEKAKKADIIEKATYNLYRLKHEAGPYRTYQVAILLRDANAREIVKGELKTENINNILNSFILTSGVHQMDNINKFMKLVEMQDSIDSVEKFEIMYLFQQALNVNIIGERDNVFVWHNKAGHPNVYELGSNFDKIVNFFLKEYREFNPDSELTNWYNELKKDVVARGVWFG